MDVSEISWSGITAHRLRNTSGLEATIIPRGATLISVRYPNRQNQQEELTLNYDTANAVYANKAYYGATIGRVANRINAGKFELDGVEYQLALNHGKHHLHGGTKAMDKAMFTALPAQRGDDYGKCINGFSVLMCWIK